MKEGQRQNDGDGVQVGAAGGRPAAHEVNEAGLVGGDLAVDPGLILGHSGVDSWSVWLSAALAEAHHTSQNPLGFIFSHQRAARIALNITHTHTEINTNQLRCNPFPQLYSMNETISGFI